MPKIVKRVGLAALAALLAAAVIIVFASGMFVTKKYLDPWREDYHEKFEDIRLQVASQGLLAPNGHNMQPWKIKLDGSDKSAFYLYGDQALLPPDVDPPARQFTVSQGTFLEYCSISAGHLNRQADIVLFPDGEYDGSAQSIGKYPVAKVTLKKEQGAADNTLYNALFLPDTSRAAYRNEKLSDSEIEKLRRQNTEKDLTLNLYQDQTDMDKISRYVVESARIEGGIDAINEESVKLTRINEYQKNKYGYGFSLESEGTSGFALYTKETLVTLLPFLNSNAASEDAIVSQAEMAVENTPAYALILTKDNSRASQVQAGMLYARVQLTAESMGLAVQPLSQSIEEYSQMSELYRGIHNDYAPGTATIQMLVRIGRPVQSVPRSMRRDVNDLLIR